jgi:hypothetical protein
VVKINEIATKITIQSINETKSWFFEKSNTIDRPLANMKRRENTKLNKIKDEKVDITTNTNEI